ncbi:hypothetical protein MPER_01586, partial [Moniliophthora perniciosa FA553]
MPLPSPPDHLLNDPILRDSIQRCKDFIKVETPFNIDRLANFLFDHPNQPLVQSVLRGLREGFWPLDESDWNLNPADVVDNYTSIPDDLDAIRAYSKKEIANGHWSTPIPTLLPGMVVSPMFVVWQGDPLKPRVVTDHTGSGLNSGIPREAAKVKYDDLRAYGNSMR